MNGLGQIPKLLSSVDSIVSGNSGTKENGPASAPTLPDHGSTQPLKGMDMNIRTNSTAAADGAIASAMRDLEDDICSLLNMTRILAELLDDTLVEFGPGGTRVGMPKKGETLKVMIGHDEMEMLSFAWNDVINRTVRLKDNYYRAFDAEVLA